jgi:hypothetical protein
MFGYVMPDKPDLKIKEFELFKAYYCGVCKSIGKRYGLLPRLTLNYDSTFLALLFTSLRGDVLKVKRERCIVHPVKKRAAIKENEIIDYASDINVILAYYNLEDKRRDNGSKLSAAAMLVLKSDFKKLRSKYSGKCDIIENRLKELDKLEKEKCSTMDAAAEPFAKLMEEVLDYKEVFKDEKLRNLLRWIGYNMGKWIYILDAYDDLEEDIKDKHYNPLIYQYSYNNEDIKAFKLRIKEQVEFNLIYTLSEISKAFELLELKQNRGLVDNIVYMGMLRKTEQILNAGSCKKVEESI